MHPLHVWIIVGLLVVAAARFAYYWIDCLWFHHFYKCPPCKGNAKIFNRWNSNVFRLCERCKGTGRLLRWPCRWYQKHHPSRKFVP